MKKILTISLTIIMLATLFGCKKTTTEFKRIATPTGFGEYVAESKSLVEDGYIYVATNGDDEWSGSKTRPFKTIERAKREASPNKNKVVIKAGEYFVDNLLFDEINSGTTDSPITYVSYGDGEVILNGGVKLAAGDFEAVTGEQKERLKSDAQNNVVCVDLAKYGITAEDYGRLFALGAYKTDYKYTDVPNEKPAQCELFVNDERLTLARYPNKDNLKLGKVNDIGDCYEPKPQVYRPEWHDTVNPRGGTFAVDKGTTDLMKSWKNLNDIWLFGYFYWDWADMSTPIANFNADSSELTTKYCSKYGFKENANYYFYNVYEELDTDGEWYLDRDTGVLYIYSEDGLGEADVQLSLTTKSVIEIDGAENIVFDGLTIKGSRENGMKIVGNNITARNMKVYNTANEGIYVDGYNNIIEHSEISRVGRNGVVLKGGDRSNLTPSGNIARRNEIYRVGELQKTYISGISLHGVGALASNNDIHDTPHMAIFYEGNDHVMQYNRIYDAVKYSSDAGAIYAGRNLSYYGNKVLYNCIYNIGGGEFKPVGIYFDDALAGQTAVGNILINIPSAGILIGGGRDCNVTDNLVVNAEKPIHFDDRAYEGYFKKGWYKKAVAKPDGTFWTLYNEAKALNDGWNHKYEGIDAMTDFNSSEKLASFAVTPFGSVVSNNMLISVSGKIGYIGKGAKKFATIENNHLFKLSKINFSEYAEGDYSFLTAGKTTKDYNFEALPFDKIGRGGKTA